MLAMKCDRCGGLYEEYGDMEVDNTITNGIALTFSERCTNCNPHDNLMYRTIYDLCPDCMAELRTWLHGENATRHRRASL